MIEPFEYGRRYYTRDAERWPSGARYRILGWAAVAVFVLGELLEEDTSGMYCSEEEPALRRTGLVGVVMVGDDYAHPVDPSRLVRIGRGDYCGECGQIGCGHGAGADDDDEGGEA